MKTRITEILHVFLIALLLFTLVGCIEVLGAVGTGVVMTGEYLVTGRVTKTVSYDFRRIKSALLVALCKMQITVERAREIEEGEEVIAAADELEIWIELKQITPSVTRISVRAEKGFLNRDKATAQEILAQTNKIAEKLVRVSAVEQNGTPSLGRVSGEL